MLDQVLSLFDIKYDYDLNIMKPDQALSQLTAALLSAIDPIVSDVKPNWILAQGDTTTALAAALTAFYHRIPFAHVEAGLRTGDLVEPFPEEMNRRIADSLSEILFAPTERNRLNLLQEGISDKKIVVTGNTVIDAMLEIASRPFDWESGQLAETFSKEHVVLITAHRRESFGQPLMEICAAIKALSSAYLSSDIQFVYPVHMNPNVQEPVERILSNLPNVSLIKPVDYISLVHLMKRATVILTDSGGIQEEAPSFGVPVLVMREKTERPEGIDAGVVKLVGTDRNRIVAETKRLLDDPKARTAKSKIANPYGDGKAAPRIVSSLLKSQ